MEVKNKLKIAFIGWANSMHVQRWVQWFARRGHEVHLISHVDHPIDGVITHSLTSRSFDPKAEAEDMAPNRSPWSEFYARLKFNYLSYLKYPLYALKVKKLLDQIQPDLVQGFYLGFAGYLGAAAGARPLLIFTGGPDLMVFPRKFWFHRVWTRLVIPRVDYLIHTSEEANEAARDLGADPQRSKFLHPGIDLNRFNPELDPGDLKRELGISGCPMVLSTRGLYDAYYNISGLLRTFALVLKQVPEARLVLKYYSASEKDKFVRLAQELMIYDKIVWVGRVDYEKMPSFYRAASVYVSLSYADSGPVSMLEAMACGCVPIVSRLKNIQEWVTQDQTGYLVDSDDHQGAASAIVKVLRNEALGKKIGEKCVQQIAQRADQEIAYREIEKISFDLVKREII